MALLLMVMQSLGLMTCSTFMVLQHSSGFPRTRKNVSRPFARKVWITSTNLVPPVFMIFAVLGSILLGWASELPVLVQMNALPEHHRPKSDDPDFWAVWSGQGSDGKTVERNVDWKEIADYWQQIRPSNEGRDEELEL